MRNNLDSAEYDKKRTITMTFRIEKNIMTNLRREASSRGTSLNMLINQIFKNFVDWRVFETKIGMVPMPKPVVLEMFKNLSKDEIIDVAAGVGKREIHDIILFMKTKIDMDSFIEWISTRMRNSSMHITHLVNGNIHVYTMKHNVCLNWSLYHKIILESIFNEIIGKEVKIDISETAFTIRFEK